jgi:choline dehydrogenase
VLSFLNVLLRPGSKGTVRLTGRDPAAPLAIDPRYLTSPGDIVRLRSCLRLTLRIAERLRERGYAVDTWPQWSPEAEDDAALDAFIRKRNRTTYHYTSTCRMAPENDPNGGGVVDDYLRVHGVLGLRVADSSIFPNVLGTHTQAPTVAVAEKCADMILNGL